MTKHITGGRLAARTLALSIAAIGIAIGPGGFASGAPPHVGPAGETLAADGEALTSRSYLGDRCAVAWDDGSDSGDGGDGDDGGDSED
jgi:hypothetical protein